MTNRAFQTTLLYVLILAPAYAHSQVEFAAAHEILQDLQDRRRTSRTLAETRQLGEEERAAPAKVETLLTAAILKYLDEDGSPSADSLRLKLRTVLQVGAEQPPPGTNAEAFVFQTGSTKGGYIVAYNVSYCVACSRSWVGVFAPESGHYKVVASPEDPLPNQSLTAVPLWGGGNLALFLLYGTNWGDTHNRMNAAVYRYDGLTLSRIWERSGLPQGTVQLAQGKIAISFLTALRPPWERRTEVYGINGNAIVLESTSEEPEL